MLVVAWFGMLGFGFSLFNLDYICFDLVFGVLLCDAVLRGVV